MSAIPAGWVFVGNHPDGSPMYRKPALILKNEQGIKTHAVYPPPAKKRVRQPKSLYDSELEKEFHDYLLHVKGFRPESIQVKGIRLRLPGGVFYTPDFVWAIQNPFLYEVKGPKESKGASKGVMIFKLAAGCWQIFTFIFAYKKDGQWVEEVFKP